MIFKKISKCRICGNKNLDTVIDLGKQALTGLFPLKDEVVAKGPLELVRCKKTTKKDTCGLLQLNHNYNLAVLYGDNYGYRSSLNKSMVKHLHEIVKKIEERVEIQKGDLIIDIASNDCTLLKAYSIKGIDLIGIDPTIKKFKEFYPPHIQKIPDFFSSKTIKSKFSKKAKVITSIAMFYDLEAPIQFMEEIKDVLADDGIWVLEQSYMPGMLDNVSYDTICHEHIEYYALQQIKWMTDRVGLKILDVELNDINGASFCVTVAKNNAPYKARNSRISSILQDEVDKGINKQKVYAKFEKNVKKHREDLRKFLKKAKKGKKTIMGYGASTKGNVILQYCNITRKDIPFIADVNEYKHGRYTPGTKIPIISENEAKAMNPDYFMVLPWHFKNNIIEREKEFLKKGRKLFFPLPTLELV